MINVNNNEKAKEENFEVEEFLEEVMSKDDMLQTPFLMASSIDSKLIDTRWKQLPERRTPFGEG